MDWKHELKRQLKVIGVILLGCVIAACLKSSWWFPVGFFIGMLAEDIRNKD